MTVRKIFIALGYDNELTVQDVNAIQHIKKWDKDRKYAWHFLYSVPKIPAVCFLESEFRIIEKTYRDEAKVVLQQLSETLGIPLPSRGSFILYHEMIKCGPTALLQAVKNKGEDCVILTPHPAKLKFDLFDRTMHWIKATKLWQQMRNQFLASSPSDPVTLLTPQQFAKQNQTRRLNEPRTPHANSSQAITSTHPHTKMWQETKRHTSDIKIKESLKMSLSRKSDEEETRKEEALMHLGCKLQF